MPASLIHHLRHFQAVSEADEQWLTQALQPRFVAENAVLLRPGPISQEIFFIIDGVLRIVN